MTKWITKIRLFILSFTVVMLMPVASAPVISGQPNRVTIVRFGDLFE